MRLALLMLLMRLMLLMLLALVRGPCAAYALLTTGAAYARLMRGLCAAGVAHAAHAFLLDSYR